jgi:hypothetical protein
VKVGLCFVPNAVNAAQIFSPALFKLSEGLCVPHPFKGFLCPLELFARFG